MFHSYIAVLISILIVAGVAAWYCYWKHHAARLRQNSCMGPNPSCVAELAFNLATRMISYLTIGPVKVINGHKSPLKGRAVFIANHQVRDDFAMLRRGSGRHFRPLTKASELQGLMGVLAAWSPGVISISYKDKEQRHAAEECCVETVSQENGSLGIFPEGNLLPDNPDLTERFLPGAVRIARSASRKANAPVQIVPIGIYYEQDPAKADWSQCFLKRSSFQGMRDPRKWDPIFKIEPEKLNSDAEREQVKAEQKAKLEQYRNSRLTLYGGVVVVGDPIDVNTLPEDEDEASLVLRDRVKALVEAAKQESEE